MSVSFMKLFKLKFYILIIGNVFNFRNSQNYFNYRFKMVRGKWVMSSYPPTYLAKKFTAQLYYCCGKIKCLSKHFRYVIITDTDMFILKLNARK